MATNKIKLVVKPTRSIPMVVKPVPKIGLMSMTPTKGDPGVGIESLEQTTKSTESGGTNVWTATLTDGTVHDFEVMNGEPGEGIATGGTPGQVLVKASNADYATRWMSILPEDTASGSVASFPDGSDDLPMGVVVDIEPVQDLHGFDNPWPAGGGKNLLPYPYSETTKTTNGITYTDNGDGTITVNGTATASAYFNMIPGAALPLKAGTYTFSGQNGGVNLVVVDSSIHYVSATGYTVTYDADVTVNMYLRVANGTTISSLVIKPQVELGSAATSWSPYSNVCPVSGRTGAKVTRTGSNVWDEEYVTNGYFEADGTWRNGNYLSSKNPIPVKPNTSYYFYEGSGAAFVTFWSKEVPSGASAAQYIISRVRAENRVITTPANCVAMHFNTTDYGTVYNNNISVNYPSTVHAYEPYTAVTHEIPFSTEVYGGTLNVETGELVIDRQMVDLGTRNWNYIAPTTSIPYGTFYNTIPNKKIGQLNLVCDSYPTKQNFYNDFAIQGNSGANTVYLQNSNFNGDTVALKASLNGVMLCYELATPITLTLTPVEMRSLLGDNNVWSDTGNTTVTYKADVQKYIDKKISAAVAAMS